ncbi:alpha-amylase family glycosyl hydrolase [Fontivita pretiosa]|uniref:alpha-amylase family glycosyl hydrolase n=1 Tax=Fontivita pretiosa TaxID=2989684 RepID=UPI003D16D153
MLAAALVSSPCRAAAREHTFKFDSRSLDLKPQSVAVAGSFNGWSKDATPMTDPDGDGIYTATVKLNEGVTYYKFVVNGDRWLNDPASDRELEVDDTFGGKNSAVLIGPDIRKAPPPRPNHINEQFVLHDPKDRSDLDVVDQRTLRVRVRAQAGDVQAVEVVARNADVNNSIDSRLQKLTTDAGFDVFGGLVVVPGAQIAYRLDLIDGTKRLAIDPDAHGVAMQPNVHTPDWAKHAVWYQIFPERFRNGDPSNDPGDREFETLVRWQADWWKTQPGEAPGQENFYRGHGNVWRRRYGGDIQGVRQALPYLRRLGVNAIYFNPVFEGDSLHKYDATDYRHIDDNFGVKGDIPIPGETDDPTTWQWSQSDRIFLDFVAEAHRQGFKVILDGVFNHVGRSHPFFQDVLKHGKNSRYADWFEITDWGDGGEPGKPGGIRWKAWDGPDGHLPVFRKDPHKGLAPGPYAHVMAIATRWLAPDGEPSRGIDGWRLDVPGDIPHPFWIDFRKVVKQTKPDAYITGEIWDWAQAWLQGDQFDAVMNYRFAVACQEFFANQTKAITASEFNSRLTQMIFAYPHQVVLAQQNLFDSHDTDRLASMFVNPDLPYDAANRIQDNGPKYKPDKPNPQQWARIRQAVTFQMCFLGAPMIYYGDEAGMWSPDDPSNRMPMWWEDLEPFENPEFQFSDEHFAHYQRVIAIRHALPALRLGFYRPIVIDDRQGVLGFTRQVGDDCVYVVLNRSDKPARVNVPVEAGHSFIDWMNPAHAELKLPADGNDRPTIAPKPGATPLSTDPDGKTVVVELDPYDTAILTPVIKP